MKLSIITINCNNKDGLQKTIDSVISQTWRDYEWIIIDGGSTDGSKELIEKYQEHFAYWCSEPDKGVYNAMNKGIAKANGEYLQFLNSGDIFYENNTLERVFSKERTGDILFGDWVLSNGVIVRFTVPVDLFAFLHRNICHQAMFIKKELLQKDGYDESFQIYADWNRWIQAAINGAVFVYLNIIICIYETGGLSSKHPDLAKIEMEKMARETIPPAIFLCLTRLREYEENIYIQYVKNLLNRSKLSQKLTTCIISILYKTIYFVSSVKNTLKNT